MAIVERLLRWLEIPINLLLWVALTAGVLMMLHVGAEVTGRTFFNSPLPGTTEIVSNWYMVAICYLPWAWITRRDDHIVAGVFERIGTAWFGYWVEVAVKILMVVYVSVFAWQTSKRAFEQMYAGPYGEVAEAAGVFIAVWPSRWLLPIGAISMGVYLVLRILRDALRGYQPEGQGSGL